MSELVFVSIFVLWYAFALIISEKYGENSRLDVEWLFFLSIIFSPVVGFIIVKISTAKQTI